MTFQPNKTLKELNIDTSRRFVVMDDDNHRLFKNGDILEWEKDDDCLPCFKRISDGNVAYCELYRLDYYNPIKTWDTLEIGDEVKGRDGYSQWVLDVHGKVIHLSVCNDKDSYWGGYTKEQLIKYGYTIVQPEPQEETDPEVEKAIKFLEDKGIIKEGKIIS